jgi:hypothetical protein
MNAIEKNVQKFSKMLYVPCGRCGDIWCAHPFSPKRGVEVIELQLPAELGESYQRCGGSDWEDVYYPVALVKGDVVALGYRVLTWHGGYNSGHAYDDFVPAYTSSDLFKLMKAWKGY